ncbi:hypothetical protein JB92DRAFT_3234904 [Gautieria morchelliformis]|nr:hypothetical protein JB92DRAFT_3234904 [Gautieria morchelliformis]
MPSSLLTPMIHQGRQDYYVFEPCLLRDDRVCMVERWFMKGARGHEQLWGKGWRMGTSFRNGQWGWVIDKGEELTFDVETLLLNYPDLLGAHRARGMPGPDSIWGECFHDHVGEPVRKWEHELPNGWRTRAKGHRVVSCPVWLYCDDTSGNRSKKWNEHYSFLFALAGLPRAQWQRDYNVHFLCTSNIASPVEMLEGVVDQIDVIAAHGVWAHDCELDEMVLFFIPVHGMLGDNPMQSEFACHIGLRGKFFCQCCWVKGRVVEDDRQVDNDSEDESGPSHEGYDVMVARITRFMQVGRPRERHETMQMTGRLFQGLQEMAPQKDLRAVPTNTGVKDTFFEHFRKKIDQARKGLTGVAAENAVMRELQNVPEWPWSSVWRLQGVDPHVDTPCEILHVVLLGIVKYFWRDAMKRLSDDQKTTVKARLSCLNVSGLDPDLTRVPGHTYVQYAGSLVGRDFHTIGQVGIFVLYDMLAPEIMAAWAAMATLLPRVWVATISDMEAHTSLTLAVNHFLATTARWTPRWFNKPKFHLLLHLPEHVRRYGPAILFATEVFQSFNAIIRSWSIHLNRLAPGRDISQRAAHCHRIRHLMSGGAYQPRGPGPADDSPTEWRTVAAGPASLVRGNSIIARYLGMRPNPVPNTGAMTSRAKARPIPWAQTRSSTYFRCPNPSQMLPFRMGAAIATTSGHSVQISAFAIRNNGPHAPLVVCQVLEAFAQIQSEADAYGMAQWVLVRDHALGQPVPPYNMPRLTLTSEHRLIPPAELCCTVNVQHNCAAHDCPLDRSQVVYQEREATNLRTAIVRHVCPADILLNTAKTRDHVWLRAFISEPAAIQLDELVPQACLQELQKVNAHV